MNEDELGAIRHDLKNVLTALRSSCMLVKHHLLPNGDAELPAILSEMRAELERGAALVPRMRQLELRRQSPGSDADRPISR